MKKILQGNWFAPYNYLENLKNTVEVDYFDQQSSSGDWSGYVIKKVGKVFKLFWFYQTNLGDRGFELIISDKASATKLTNFSEVDLEILIKGA